MPKFKYFPLILILLGGVLLTSNVAAMKLVSVCGMTLTGGFLIFPFTYTLNCIAVEVYGYKNARLAIWGGFLLCFIFVFFINLVALMPPSPYWHLNAEFKEILVPETRIIFASLISFLISDFINSYIMAKLKLKYVGESLFSRIISASFFSILIGVVIFIGLAFYGKIPDYVLLKLMIFAFVKKMVCQILFFPLTAFLVKQLRQAEGVDIYDDKTNFTPFSLDNIYNLEDYRYKESREHAFIS